MNPRVTIALTLGAVFLVGALLLVAVSADEPPARADSGTQRFEGSVLPPGLMAPDFNRIDENGKPISMRELRGQPVIVTFLYSTCIDTCPLQAQQVKGALNLLGKDVPALAVSVDPPNDNERNVRAFLSTQRVTGRLRWVLGSRRQLAPVWRAYGATPQLKNLEHNSRFVLVDRRGRQRVSFPVGEVTAERVAHDIRLLLAGR